jgi:hypothetical protein
MEIGFVLVLSGLGLRRLSSRIRMRDLDSILATNWYSLFSVLLWITRSANSLRFSL